MDWVNDFKKENSIVFVPTEDVKNFILSECTKIHNADGKTFVELNLKFVIDEKEEWSSPK